MCVCVCALVLVSDEIRPLCGRPFFSFPSFNADTNIYLYRIRSVSCLHFHFGKGRKLDWHCADTYTHTSTLELNADASALNWSWQTTPTKKQGERKNTIETDKQRRCLLLRLAGSNTNIFENFSELCACDRIYIWNIYDNFSIFIFIFIFPFLYGSSEEKKKHKSSFWLVMCVNAYIFVYSSKQNDKMKRLNGCVGSRSSLKPGGFFSSFQCAIVQSYRKTF